MAFISSLPSVTLQSRRNLSSPSQGLRGYRIGVGVTLGKSTIYGPQLQGRRPLNDRRPLTFSIQCALSQVGASGGASGGNNNIPTFKQEYPAGAIMPHKKLSLIGILFLIMTYLWSILLFIPMLIMHPFVLAFDRIHRRFHDGIAFAWFKLTMLTAGLRPRLLNPQNLPPKSQPCIFVANHQSVMDIYTCGFLGRACKYVAKADIFRLPIVGWAMAMAGNISFERRKQRGKMNAYRRMVQLLKHKISLVVFPEGTRSVTGKLKRFKKGAFRAAIATKVPVVPVTITGTREMMPNHAYVPLRYPPEPIKINVHPAIDSKGRSDEELSELAFKAIDSGLPKHLQTESPQEESTLR